MPTRPHHRDWLYIINCQRSHITLERGHDDVDDQGCGDNSGLIFSDDVIKRSDGWMRELYKTLIILGISLIIPPTNVSTLCCDKMSFL